MYVLCNFDDDEQNMIYLLCVVILFSHVSFLRLLEKRKHYTRIRCIFNNIENTV